MSTPVAPPILQMPDMFMAGTTVVYTRTLRSYSAADGWTLAVKINGVATSDSVTGSASGSDFLVTIPATATAKLPAGTYVWSEVVTSSAGTFLAAHGKVEVIPNALTASAGDLQGFEEKALAVVEVQLLARYQADVQSYSIEQRAAVKIQVERLEQTRGRLLRAIEAKKRPGRFLTPINVAFGRLTDLNPWPPGRLW